MNVEGYRYSIINKVRQVGYTADTRLRVNLILRKQVLVLAEYIIYIILNSSTCMDYCVTPF